MIYNKQKTQVLVLGAGLAGLRAAVAAVEKGASVTVLSQESMASTEVMGFNAPVNSDDSQNSFYEDIVKSGCGAGDPALHRVLAFGAVRQVEYFESLGICFDQRAEGGYDTLGVLGCSHARLVRCGGHTGQKLLNALRERAEVLGVRYVNAQATQLFVEDACVRGAWAFETDGTPLFTRAEAVILATGGNGGMYPLTTYPRALRGSGYAMALRAGAELIDMEFQQFEPCCYVWPKAILGGLASTTMLLKGGELLNSSMQPFMLDGYCVQKNVLASRIKQEVREGRGTLHGGVWYDVTMLPEEMITKDHALFYRIALSGGVDLMRDRAEVAPCPHTCIGGVRIDEECRTRIPGLFVAGEAAGGIHGANRIGGCAGTETLVFGEIAGSSAAVYAQNAQSHNDTDIAEPPIFAPTDEKTSTAISACVGRALGNDKCENGLRAGIAELENMRGQNREDGNTGDLLLVAAAQMTASLCREESRGVFHRTDFSTENRVLEGTAFVLSLSNGLISTKEIQYPALEAGI